LTATLENEQLLRQQLEWRISQLLGEKYQPSSEKISVEQLELILEGLEGETAESEEQAETIEKPEIEIPEKPKKTYPSKKTVIPDDLPTEIIEVDVPEDQRVCPDTGKPREIIRWEESEKIQWVPGHLKRVIIRRAVRAVKVDESDPLPSEPVVTAEMPADFRVIPGCIAGIGLLVQIMVGKYCDHLPLYRQQSIFEKRHNVKIDRSLMGHWIKKCALSLYILYETLRIELINEGYLQIDETFIKMIDPERKGKAWQAYFWVIKKPGAGVLFHFDPSRGHEVPLKLLSGMEGKLQSDGFGVYEALLNARAKDATTVLTLILFNCWAHARRKVKESLEANGNDAAWYLREIQKLYRVEAKARENNSTHEQREALRAEESRPILAEIKKHLDADVNNPAILPSSPLGKALSYIRDRWQYLEAYAADGNGEVEIDNNEVENAIRPTAVGKKNWLFIGHPKAGQNSAIIYTIIENCRMWNVNPFTYLVDVLPKIQDHPANRISELLPRQWAEQKKREAEQSKAKAA
jgi:transposase